MNYLLQIVQIILSCITSVVLLIVGVYFKGHVHVEKNSQNGILLPVLYESPLEGWLYAQIIGPQIVMKYGQASLITVFLINLFVLLLRNGSETLLYLGNIIGFCFVIIALMDIEGKVKDFLDGELFLQDEEIRKKWISKVKELIETESYEKTLKFVQKDCIDN